MNDRLQPCPFCGAKAREIRYGLADDWFRIECGREIGPSCCHMRTVFTDESIAVLRERWNAREFPRKAVNALCRIHCEITDIALCEEYCDAIKQFIKHYDNEQ